jgi:hypothetical protein
MHPLLGRATPESHPDVLDRSAEAGRFVALHVRDDHHGVRVDRRRADSHALEVSPARYRDIDGVTPVEAVSDDEWRLDRGVREAVVERTLEMVHGVGALTSVERVRVGEKRPAASVLDPADHLANMDGVDEPRVPLFAEVELHRNEVLVEDGVLEAGSLEQRAGTADHAALHLGSDRREVDLWSSAHR